MSCKGIVTPMLSTKQSCMMSLLMLSFLLSGLFTFRDVVKNYPIFGGFLSSFMFVLLLVAVGNCEKILFGSDYQLELLPEVVTCLIVTAVTTCFLSMISFTTCVLFSCLHTYFLNQMVQSQCVSVVDVTRLKKSKKQRRTN